VSHWRRHPAVTTTTLDGEAFLVRADTDTILLLNPTATAIWNALEDETRRADLLTLFTVAFPGEPADRVAADLDQTLAALAEAGMIEMDDT